MSLLFLDTTIAGYEQIQAAASCHVILFDRFVDTYATLLEKKAGDYTTVGIVQHGSYNPAIFTMLESEKPVLYEDESSWTDIGAFFKGLGATTIDLISCRLYDNPGMVSMMQTMESQLGINLRASRDDTGNLASGGNWTQESDGVDIRDLYFTEAIEEWRGLLVPIFFYRSSQMVRKNQDLSTMMYSTIGLSQPMISKEIPVDPTRFVKISDKPFRIATAWGRSDYGGSSAPTDILKAIISNSSTFAAIKLDGTLVCWGVSSISNKVMPSGNFVALASCNSGFAAIREDGTIAGWGINPTYSDTPTGTFDYIASTSGTFSGLRKDGTIATWGSTSSGARNSPEGTYIAVASNSNTFAALKSDGTITAWGSQHLGGVAPSGTYTAITSTVNTFAALKPDGAIAAWGNTTLGGTNSPQGSYIAIAANSYAYAGLKQDGTIIVWGSPNQGGVVKGRSTPDGIDIISPTGEFRAIASSNGAFTAMRPDGTVACWTLEVNGAKNIPTDNNIDAVTCTNNAFSALKTDGSIIVWGDITYGGSNAPSGKFKSIASTNFAFAAIKDEDSSIISWGSSLYGLNKSPTGTGYTELISNYYAFLGIKQVSTSTKLTTFKINQIDVSGTYLEVPFTSQLTFTVAPDAGATISDISGQYTGLTAGTYSYSFTVTAEDRVTTQVYQVSVRILSNDTSLRTFTINGRSVLNTATLDLSAGTTQIDISAGPTHAAARVDTIVGQRTGLTAGRYTYTFTVTAEDGTMEHYSRQVHIFSNDTGCTYSIQDGPAAALTPTSVVSLPARTTTVTFAPALLADISGSTTLTGLRPTQTYRPTFTVIAEDGTQLLYTPTFYVKSDDTRIHVLVGATIYDLSNGYVELPTGTTGFSILPKSNLASMPPISPSGLITGYFPYTVTVTAEDPAITQTHSITVRILPSTDTTLQIYRIHETQTAHGSTHYFPPDTRAAPITAVTTHPRASYTILGHTHLQPGINPVIVRVTAEDGVTVQDHIINVVVKLRPIYAVSSHTSLTEARRGQQTLVGYIEGSRISDYEAYMRMKRYYR